MSYNIIQWSETHVHSITVDKCSAFGRFEDYDQFKYLFKEYFGFEHVADNDSNSTPETKCMIGLIECLDKAYSLKPTRKYLIPIWRYKKTVITDNTGKIILEFN